MAHTFAVLSLLASAAVSANSAFDTRVQRAKVVEDSPAGRAYQDKLWPLVRATIARTMENCAKTYPNAEPQSFVWVGTVTAKGKIVDAEVEPNTDLSKCFVRSMTRVVLPWPSSYFKFEGMPITFNMRLHPMK